MNLLEYQSQEELERVRSAWKYLPPWRRKYLRVKFQLLVLRYTLPDFIMRVVAFVFAIVYFFIVPIPRTYKKQSHQEG